MRLGVLVFIATIAVLPCDGARAQSPAPSGPAIVVGGSPDVFVGDSSVSRLGDPVKNGGPVAQGSPDVLINGRPAATSGAQTACGGAIGNGAPSVFVNGKPLARSGEATTDCMRK
jgi:uncharacterized Zn-binding protein involved in type VI secretion